MRRIGPVCRVRPGVTVRKGAEIRAFCHIENAEIGAGAIVGPFARLRGGAKLDDGVDIGNFVELKNAHLEKGAKANHLTYVGDAHVGARANIGAGTITCNYDGVSKHRTEIGADAFIGSNTALVAPVKIGEGAIVAAGSRDHRRSAAECARARPRAPGHQSRAAPNHPHHGTKRGRRARSDVRHHRHCGNARGRAPDRRGAEAARISRLRLRRHRHARRTATSSAAAAPASSSSSSQLLKEKPLAGFTGIGHTRWATHGAPTERNAHPHASSRVALVHNGIIENFRELKDELRAGRPSVRIRDRHRSRRPSGDALSRPGHDAGRSRDHGGQAADRRLRAGDDLHEARNRC